MPALLTLTLKPGYGYYDITSYPLGGCFRRAPKDTGLHVTASEAMRPARGCDRVGVLDDGRRIAFAYANTIEGEALNVTFQLDDDA